MLETVGTCAHCNGSVRATTGPQNPLKPPPPATCSGCGRTWPRLKEWGGAASLTPVDVPPMLPL